jgi:nicotinamide-nucleotide amidase
LGIVAYSNQAKENLLGISPALIKRFGAVSKEVACHMAEAARKIAKADFGIGITGIAGPTGGTPTKPAGTVFVAIETKDKKICKRLHFKGSRSDVRQKAALYCLSMLKALLR